MMGENPIIFWNLFINSNVAKQIEKGTPKYLTCSALDYLNEIYENKKHNAVTRDINKDKYFCAGWILAQLHTKKDIRFIR